MDSALHLASPSISPDFFISAGFHLIQTRIFDENSIFIK